MTKVLSIIFFLLICSVFYFLFFLLQTNTYDDLSINLERVSEKHINYIKENKKISKDVIDDLHKLVDEELIETKDKKHIDSH